MPNEFRDYILTIEPLFSSSFQQLSMISKVAFRLTDNVFSIVDWSYGLSEAIDIPALLTRPSIIPNSWL